MAEQRLIDAEALENEVRRLKKSKEEILKKMHDYDDRIGFHNQTVRELCKERRPIEEEYHKIYKEVEIAEKALEFAKKFLKGG